MRSASGSTLAEGIRITLDGKPVEFASPQAKYEYSSFGGTSRNYVTFTSADGSADPASGMRKIQVEWSYSTKATGSTEVEKADAIAVILTNDSGYQNYTPPKPEGMVIELAAGQQGTVERIMLALEAALPEKGAWPARTIKVECNAKQAR